MKTSSLLTATLALAIAAPTASARPADPDPVAPATPPVTHVAPAPDDGGGLDTAWIVAAGALAAAGAGFVGARRREPVPG